MNLQANDLSALPHWNLSNIYPGLQSEPFVQSVTDLRTRLDEIDAFMADHRISREADTIDRDHAAVKTAIDGYLDRMNALLRLYGTLNAYVTGHVATDSYDTTAKRLLSELDLLGVRLRQQSLRFQAWLGSVGAALPSISDLDGPARAHTFFLRETAEQSRYLMSDREEALAAELAPSGESAWSKLQGTVCSQLTVDFEKDGKTEKLPMTALQNLHQHDPDPDVRRRAYAAELAAWESVREPLAAALNGVKGAASTLNRRRGRVDALHASIDQSRIDRKTLETLIGAMQDSFPMFRRYLKIKARRLGHAGALPWWDIFAPVGSMSVATPGRRPATWLSHSLALSATGWRISPARFCKSLDRCRTARWQGRRRVLHESARRERVAHSVQLRRLLRPGLNRSLSWATPSTTNARSARHRCKSSRR